MESESAAATHSLLTRLQRGWAGAAERLERACRPPPDLDGDDPTDRLRQVALPWSCCVSAFFSAAAGLWARWHGRTTLTLMAIGVLLGAGFAMMRMRSAGVSRRVLVGATLAVVLGTAIVADAAFGRFPVGFEVCIPLLALACSYHLPRNESLVGSAIIAATGLLAIGTRPFTPTGGHALGSLAFPFLLAWIVHARSRIALGRIDTAIRESVASVRLLEQAERRVRERFRDCSALSDSWYWETDAELRLSHVAIGLVRQLGIVDRPVHGRTLPELIRSAKPSANGIYDLSDAMTYELGIRGRKLIWFERHGQAVVLTIDAWPAYTAFGSFRGYRGRVRAVTRTRRRSGRAQAG